MTDYTQLPNDQTIASTIAALQANGFAAEVVDDLSMAKQKVLDQIPAGSRVFTATSVTLQQAGLEGALNGDPYVSMRNHIKRCTAKKIKLSR